MLHSIAEHPRHQRALRTIRAVTQEGRSVQSGECRLAAAEAPPRPVSMEAIIERKHELIHRQPLLDLLLIYTYLMFGNQDIRVFLRRCSG